MKNIVKLGLLALVTTSASLQAAYDKVTIQKFLNQIPGNPEIAYRILRANGEVVQDWTKIFTDQAQNTLNINLTLERESNGFQKLEFKKVGYDRNGWSLQPYSSRSPSEFYQPSGSNQTLSIGFEASGIQRIQGTTVQAASKIRVVDIVNKNANDPITVIFSHEQGILAKPLAKYVVQPNTTLQSINFVESVPLVYKVDTGVKSSQGQEISSTADPVFIDKEGILNVSIISAPTTSYEVPLPVR